MTDSRYDVFIIGGGQTGKKSKVARFDLVHNGKASEMGEECKMRL